MDDMRQSLRELAEQLAVSEIQQYFQDPVHLEDLSKVKEEYERKLIAVETQLDAGVQAQLDEMQNAVTLLRMAKDEMKRVRDRFALINKKCDGCTTAIGDFEHIVKIRNARANVQQILQQLEIYDAVPRWVAELNVRLDQDSRGAALKPVFLEWLQLNSWRERILSQVSNAVTEASKTEEMINQRLENWEELDSSVHANYGNTAESYGQILIVLADHFRKVEELGERIWQLVSARLSDFFDLSQSEDASQLVVAVEIVERIDMHDDKERNRRAALGEDKERLEMLMPPNKRRSDARKVIERAIDAHLDVLLPPTLVPKFMPIQEGGGDDESDDDEDDTSKIPMFLQIGDNLIVDLQFVLDDVIRCFPAHYNIYGLYRWVVERRLLDLFAPIWDERNPKVSSSDRLYIIGWLHLYIDAVEKMDAFLVQAMNTSSSSSSSSNNNSNMGSSSFTYQQPDQSSSEKRVSGTFGQDPSSSASMTEDHRQAGLQRIKEFKTDCDRAMGQYILNSFPRMKGYVDAILNRKNVPETSIDGALQTPNPEDLFHALSQELNVVTSHGVRGSYLASFVQKAVLKSLKLYQSAETKKIQDPKFRVMDDKVDITMEWVCAFMNDYERMYDLCDNALIIEVRNGIVSNADKQSEALMSDILHEVDQVASGFIKGVEVGSARLVDEIFRDLLKKGEDGKTVFDSLFTKEWESDTARTVARFRATFEDFFDNREFGLRVWLSSEINFGQTVAQALARIMNLYVLKFLERTKPFDSKARVIQRLRNDAKDLENCFIKYLDVLKFGKVPNKIPNEKAFYEKFAIIRQIADILEDHFPQNHFEDIGGDFGPFTQLAVSRLLYYRGDLTPEEREDLKSYVVSSDYIGGTSDAARFDLTTLPPIQNDTTGVVSTGSSQYANMKPVSKKKNEDDEQVHEMSFEDFFKS